jgi:hypothetical protein
MPQETFRHPGGAAGRSAASASVQALDRATGYLMAAAVLRGLVDGVHGNGAITARLSLARTASPERATRQLLPLLGRTRAFVARTVRSLKVG